MNLICLFIIDNRLKQLTIINTHGTNSPKTTINSLLFEIKNYPYLRAIEDQKYLLSFRNYENILLYDEISQFMQNEEWYQKELTKREKEVVKLHVRDFKKDKLIAKLNANISESSASLDKRLVVNNCQILDQMETLFGGLSKTLINSNEESLKINKSLRKTMSKLRKKQQSKKKQYKNKIQILTENISDLKFVKSKLDEHCKKLEQENEILKKQCEIVEHDKYELSRLRNESVEIETLCNSLRKSNTKLKLDNNNLHSTIMDLKIDLNDSRLNIEYFQEELEEIENDKMSLKQSNDAFQITVVFLMTKNNDYIQQVKYRDNDIAWYHCEYTKAKHELIKINNIVADLKQSLSNEIKSKTEHRKEFGVINSLLTKKEIEVTELHKQLKSLQRENLNNRTSFLITESTANELRNKLRNIKSTIATESPKEKTIVTEITDQKDASSVPEVEDQITDEPDWAIY